MDAGKPSFVDFFAPPPAPLRLSLAEQEKQKKDLFKFLFRDAAVVEEGDERSGGGSRGEAMEVSSENTGPRSMEISSENTGSRSMEISSVSENTGPGGRSEEDGGDNGLAEEDGEVGNQRERNKDHIHTAKPTNGMEA